MSASAGLDYLKNQLLSVNGVQAVSVSSNTPVEDANDMEPARFDHAGKDGFLCYYQIRRCRICVYLQAAFDSRAKFAANMMTRGFLVNEALMKKDLGIKNPDDIIGKEISIWNGMIKCPVVGVLKDFNDRSLRDNLAPLLITTDVAMYNQAAVKLTTTNLPSTLESVKNIFEQTFPDFVYDYKFLDEKVAEHKQETQLAGSL